MKATSPISVLLVDDSLLVLKALAQVLSKEPDIKIVGQALSGMEALRLIPLVNPHIVCTDYFMPQINGLELTKRIMENFPLPILVMSSLLNPKDSKEVFHLLEAGALDCIEKPLLDNPQSIQNFVERIRFLSKVYVIKKKPLHSVAASYIPHDQIKSSYRILALGSSTGGPKILLEILKTLPAQFPVPIICVQHISKGFLKGFAEWLQSYCQLKIVIVEKREPLKPGKIYLAAEDTHLGIDENLQAYSAHDPPINGHRPSIDFTMSAVAQRFGSDAIGVILTGMGSDGADGIAQIFQKGGLTIAQNKETCAVFGMPKEAIDRGVVSLVLSPLEISSLIIKIFDRIRNK